jgi:hypothetical protein
VIRYVAVDLGLISFVIPSYNYGRFVGEAVDSVLAQSYPNVEVVVIDDGSTDDTRERLAKYGARISYVYQDNTGMSGARNAGIRMARGEFVGLLDADDLIHPQLVATLASAIVRERLDGVCGRIVDDLSDFGVPLPEKPPCRIIEVEDLLSGSPLSSSGMLLRKSSVLAVGGFNVTMRSAEDRDLWLRLAVNNRIGVLDCKAFYYRQHPDQTNRKTETMLASYPTVLDRFFAEHPGYDALSGLAYGYMHFGASVGFLAEGSRDKALRHVLASLRHYPFAAASRGRLSSVTRLKLLARLLVGERVFRMVARTRG